MNISHFAWFLAARRRRVVGGAVVVLIALSLGIAPAHAVVRYVSPGGNDSNTGLTPATAWATIGRANTTLAPGDVCIVAPGTSSMSLMTLVELTDWLPGPYRYQFAPEFVPWASRYSS